MAEEEKKAIENLIKSSTYSNYDDRDYSSCICFKKDVIMVLNLIQKQQKEIKHWKKGMEIVDKDHINYINKLTLKLEKKDKIIDLMAEKIVELKPCRFVKQKGGELLGEYRLWNKDEREQYFEKKVKDD